MSQSPQIVSYEPDSVETKAYGPSPERLLAGSFEQTARTMYATPAGKLATGIWTGEVGKIRIDYQRHEFCYILRGRLEIADEDGRSRQFGAGDAFMVPRSFKGTWENLEAVEKYFVLVDVED